MDLSEVNITNTNRHPWELSRRDSLLNILKKSPPDLQYADIGSGDLFFSKALQKITNKPVYAVDIYYENIVLKNGIILANNLDNIPQKSLDFLLLMDVLEHIQDDGSFLKYLNNKLSENGKMLITVPAFQFLYSQHDKLLKHYRRYSYNNIILLLRDGFEVEEAFYFYTTLFFIRFMERIFSKFSKRLIFNFSLSNWKFNDFSFITILIKCILDADFKVNRYLGKFLIKLPGLSLCIICKKKSV